MNSSGESQSEFQEVALPHVDGALAELADKDRAAVILRFLQQRSFQDVAEALGTSEDAAKKRVNRALEKLRRLLVRRGIALPVTALAAGLSQMTVTAAPVGLSSTLAALAASGATPTLSTSTSIFDCLRTPQAKAAVAIGLVLLCLLAVLLLRPDNNTMTTVTNPNAASIPRISLVSVIVDDQDKALQFYTSILGFVKKFDVPTGEPGGARWLTVVSPDDPEGMELLLEPIGFAAAKVYQKALFDSAKPWAALATSDVRKHFDRMKNLGVKFSKDPTTIEGTTIAVLSFRSEFPRQQIARPRGSRHPTSLD
jgi:catechol 2,3-dioxygenase-like lactoylglutathione lyase family enzyme